MSHPHIIDARHKQGLAAYRSGLSLRELIGVFEEIDEMHNHERLTNEQHDAIDNAGPSLVAGFADGLIEDIRLLASARRGQRA